LAVALLGGGVSGQQIGGAVPTFEVEDVPATYERLRESGVDFFTEPTAVGTATIAIFDDTGGNLIQIYETP
jgi:predicted enzyme related to lactoylglutathione lyase